MFNCDFFGASIRICTQALCLDANLVLFGGFGRTILNTYIYHGVTGSKRALVTLIVYLLDKDTCTCICVDVCMYVCVHMCVCVHMSVGVHVPVEVLS